MSEIDQLGWVASQEGIDSSFLVDLERVGVLTPHQIALLMERWPRLDADWATNPYFGTVPAHARAYVERLANRATGEAL